MPRLTLGNLQPVVDTVLRQSRWLSTAWDLANLYLAGFDKAILSKQAPLLAGLSEETTRYLSVDYFHTEDTFEDFLVHEAAHVFHNCKRETIGLRKIRGREWLLEIDSTKRECSPMPALFKSKPNASASSCALIMKGCLASPTLPA